MYYLIFIDMPFILHCCLFLLMEREYKIKRKLKPLSRFLLVKDLAFNTQFHLMIQK